MAEHVVVPHQAWIAARSALLAKEKEFTQLRDQLSQARRDLPWEAVDKEYVFVEADGRRTLLELFDGRSQLIVYHFMFDPGWDAGCPHCSFWADNFDRIVVHLEHRDATLVAVSRAPFAKLDAYRERMGWSFTWVSSSETDFNYDYGVSFTPEDVTSGDRLYNYGTQAAYGADREGTSVFSKGEDGRVFHTYSAYSRGIDMLNVAYHYLDLVPKGRDEAGNDGPQFWVRRHDEYDR